MTLNLFRSSAQVNGASKKREKNNKKKMNASGEDEKNSNKTFICIRIFLATSLFFFLFEFETEV